MTGSGPRSNTEQSTHEVFSREEKIVAGSDRAFGFVMAFVSSALVVRPFLNYVRRSGFWSFAWYRIVAGLVLLAALAAGWGR